MRRICLGVFLITMATLAIELLLTRVFDVVLNYNISYFIVTSAVFAIGLAGIYVSLRPLEAGRDIRPLLAGLSVACAVAVLLLHPVINALPFDPDKMFNDPLKQAGFFIGIYLALITPFFISGYILIAVFSSYTSKIQMLYFWDLTGAGIGCALIIPFIPMIGPGGLIVCSAGVMLLAAALFSSNARITAACVVGAAAVMVVPFLRMPHYIDFDNHQEHRGIVADKAAGHLEVTRWDPISKIEVLDQAWTPARWREPAVGGPAATASTLPTTAACRAASSTSSTAISQNCEARSSRIAWWPESSSGRSPCSLPTTSSAIRGTRCS